MPIATAIAETLRRYENVYGQTDGSNAFRAFLAHCPTPTDRRHLFGHVTGSALVWHPTTHSVLRVFHAKLKRWIFSAGGHVEADEFPWQASCRELAEETGIVLPVPADLNGAPPLPLLLHAHPIPVNSRKNEPPHWHYDMVYLYRVEERPQVKADPNEVEKFHWVDVDQVTTENAPINLRHHLEAYLKA